MAFSFALTLTNNLLRGRNRLILNGSGCDTLYIYWIVFSDFCCCFSYSFCSQSFNLFGSFFFVKCCSTLSFILFLIAPDLIIIIILHNVFPSRINERYFNCCLWMKRWNRLPARNPLCHQDQKLEDIIEYKISLRQTRRAQRARRK